MATESERGSVLRILIATDNHLGVWERDPIRKDDSFRTFEEIFQIAKELQVDLVLLGGDLFHDNKPTRNTLVRAMNIIQEYSFCDDPVRFQILSNEAENFVSGIANFKNGNYNVGLPVFTIHGNHDDPAGVDNLSAVDVLSSCNLVNYFGKISLGGSQEGSICLKPILIEKGKTKVALYGLGNLRDERLGRLFQIPGRVTWARPEASPGYATEDWLSILTIHQNRAAHTQSAKNYIKDTYLPGFLDFVVWGHEHECITETAETATGIQILQPGSSVATALSEGESKKKHVFMLEVVDQNFRTIKQELQSVRPFAFDQVVLGDQMELDAEDMEGIANFLENRVQHMIDNCNRKSAASSTGADSDASLPLVRLRVDYTGFGTINTQRFGQKFVGKVANPHDVLHWHKNASKRNCVEIAEGEAPPRPETVDEDQIAELVEQNLAEKLTILPEVELAQALHDYVDKDEKQALASVVSNILQGTHTYLTNNPTEGEDGDDDENVDKILANFAQQYRQNALVAAGARSRQARDSTQLPDPSAEPRTSARQATGQAASALALSDDEEPAGTSRSTQTTQRERGRGRGRGRGGRQTTLGETLNKRKRPAPAALQEDDDDGTTARPAKAPRRTPRRQAATKAKPVMDDDDDFAEGAAHVSDVGEVDEVENSDDDLLEAPARRATGQLKIQKQKGQTRGGSTGKRKSAQKGMSLALSSDDNDDIMPPPAARQRAGTQQTATTGGRRKLPGSLFSSLTQNSSQARRK